MPDGAEIRFLPFAGRRIAYEVAGEGPPLVVAAWWLSHLELERGDPSTRRFWEAVGEGFTLVRYDRLGAGMSDRELPAGELSLDREVAMLTAVIDELGLERVSLIGGSSGGCAAVAFAARYPERVQRLLLYGTYADGSAIAPPQVREAIVATVRSHWGLGSRLLADMFLGEADSAEQKRFAGFQRSATSADTAAALLELIYRNDVRAEAERVRAPTLVTHRRGDRAIPYELGRELASAIPGSVLVPLDGGAHFPWRGDAPSVVRAWRSALDPPGVAVSADRDADHAPAQGPEAEAAALLSRREREVLALVAAGLTDREIAEQLVLSRHTVHRHVANIRHKLGRGSRTAAVAEAARLGLL